MMTVQQVIDQFRIRMPSCDATEAKTLFDQVYRELMSSIEVRKKEFTINLVANQQSYDLNEECFDIIEAYYKPSSNAGSWFPIQLITYDKLSQLMFGWRMTQDSTGPYPLYAWVTGADSGSTAANQIGFYPTPSSTTSSGYPVVGLYTYSWAALSLSDTIPSNLLSETVFVAGMASKWSMLDGNEAQYAFWLKVWETELQKNQVHAKSMIAGPSMEMSYGIPRRRAI